jgi:hypothetical protein
VLGFFYLTRRDGSAFEQFLNGKLLEQTNAEQDQKGQEDVNIHQKKEERLQRLARVNEWNYSPKKWLLERTTGIRPKILAIKNKAKKFIKVVR